MAGGEEEEISLETTPTYAVAAVVAVFVFVSVAAERSIHYFGVWLKRRRRWKSMFKALDRMKEELMLLGLISLLLTAFSSPISKICVNKYSTALMPCGFQSDVTEKIHETVSPYPAPESVETHGRRLLAGGGASNSCPEGKQPFLAAEGLHQLHIFIFILAVVHIVYSCLSMGLAIYQMHNWYKWELHALDLIKKCQSMTPEERMKKMGVRRQSTFLKRHTSDSGIFNYEATSVIMCFGRQFWHAVHGSDYRTLRLAFISNHKLHLKFDFHRYILRSMEEDFETIVGISWYLWFFVIVYTLLNIISWRFYFIIAAISFVGACLVGTKLVWIMFTLATEARKQKGVVGWEMEARDNLFWFSQPNLILRLLHLILFTNAFEISTFIFYVWQFGIHSCFLGGYPWVIARIAISLAVQIQCSYITLPLYALVTHMGSHYKSAIFSDHVNQKTREWFKKSRKKKESLKYFQEMSDMLNGSLHTVLNGSLHTVTGSLHTVTSTIHHTAHGLADSFHAAKSAHFDKGKSNKRRDSQLSLIGRDEDEIEASNDKVADNGGAEKQVKHESNGK